MKDVLHITKCPTTKIDSKSPAVPINTKMSPIKKDPFSLTSSRNMLMNNVLFSSKVIFNHGQTIMTGLLLLNAPRRKMEKYLPKVRVGKKVDTSSKQVH